MLLSLLIDYAVRVSVWEDIVASAMLPTVTPATFVALAIWVVQDSGAKHLVMLELSVVDLAARPVVRARSVFLIALPLSLVDSSVCIDIEASPVHAI